MATPPGRKNAGVAPDSRAAVDAYMSRLDHPYKAEIEALRAVMRTVGPTVREGVKWNAPSFRTTEYFATTNLRAKAGVGVIFHLGAKVRDIDVRIADPDGLLTWLARDRAKATFGSVAELKARQPALVAIARQWIRHV